MARGKNQAIAERRKAAMSEIGSIDALRLKVKNLNEELAEAKAKYESSIEAKNENIRELSRKLKENTSAELEESKELVEKLKVDLGNSRKEEALIRKRWYRLVDILIDHYETIHKMDRLEVMTSLVAVEDGDSKTIGNSGIVVADTDLINKGKKGKLTNDQIRLLQKKRRGLL